MKRKVWIYDALSSGDAYTLRKLRDIGGHTHAFFPRNGGWRVLAWTGRWTIWADPGKRFTCKRVRP